jgi:hypothetical protein
MYIIDNPNSLFMHFNTSNIQKKIINFIIYEYPKNMRDTQLKTHHNLKRNQSLKDCMSQLNKFHIKE